MRHQMGIKEIVIMVAIFAIGWYVGKNGVPGLG